MFQATRRRLAIWYTAVTAVLLLLFAMGFYFYVRSTLIERIDDTLHHVVEVVERSLVIEPISTPSMMSPVVLGGQFQVNVEASFRDNTNAAEDDHIDLEWFNPNGYLLWSTFSMPLDIPLHPHRMVETVRIANQNLKCQVPGDRCQEATNSPPMILNNAANPATNISTNISAVPSNNLLLRQMTERVEINHQLLGYLRVSHPWFEVTKPINQLMLELSIGIGLMVISVAAIGWLLSGLAMEPVQESYHRLKQFTADASHELRNPIAMIQTHVQVALADPDFNPQEHRQYLQAIERLTRRLGKLVDDLLFLARQDSNMMPRQSVPVPVDALLMEVMEEQRTLTATQGIALGFNVLTSVFEWELPPEGITEPRKKSETNALNPPTADMEILPPEAEAFTVSGDWDQLARLFTNLLNNAVQYTPANGKIDVELQRIHPGKKNTAFATAGIQVKVKDTGIGIPPEALPHLFDRFYRVDPARTHQTTVGSGLGLAIAKAIVDHHRGYIQVDSTLDQGTIVTVILPIDPAVDGKYL